MLPHSALLVCVGFSTVVWKNTLQTSLGSSDLHFALPRHFPSFDSLIPARGAFLHVVCWISVPSPMLRQRNDLLCVASQLQNETGNLEIAFRHIPAICCECVCWSHYLGFLSRRLGSRAFLRPAFSLVFCCAKQGTGRLGPQRLL